MTNKDRQNAIEELLKDWFAALHKAGLSDKQASEVREDLSNIAAVLR